MKLGIQPGLTSTADAEGAKGYGLGGEGVRRQNQRNRKRFGAVIHLILIESGALLISLLLMAAIGWIFAILAGYFYDIHHAIPDPVKRGDDFGSGLFAVAFALGSLIVSLPASVWIHVYAFRKFY